ncbi:MAG: hypothetical protein IOC90_09975 [Methylocystis sp.]|nr:hypothetical protein [Methylocystis sp.]MCA3584112.1 hypothetical protein [Methylocystis sp.]MCA3588345.1 hypothetical protein [Methylocystis sp.]MCA3591232.1 hypothetical protein [Methylocystis sp.]
MEQSSDPNSDQSPKAQRPQSLWKATAGMLGLVAVWLSLSYLLPQGPLGWLFGWRAPSASEEACIGLLKSPLCYFSDQTVAWVTPKKTWVVIDLKLADGSTGSMAFDNRPGSNVSIEACRSALPAMADMLKQKVGEALQTSAFSIAGMKCVESATDPLRQ